MTHPKRPRDPNQLAKAIIDIATGDVPPQEERPDSPAATLGRKGGLKGGNARAAALSPAKRSEIAKRADRRDVVAAVRRLRAGYGLRVVK
jgi:hypothetical protein